MAQQSREAVFAQCARDGAISVRLEWACSRARQGAKTGSARRAEVGYCPCSTRASHVAAPLRCEVGKFPNEKARGLNLARDYGPWAARRYAAYIYSRAAGSLPRYLDWAAQPLALPAPPPFGEFIGPAHADEHSRAPVGRYGGILSDPVASPKPVSLNEMVISSRRICRIVSASRKTTKCRTERRVRGLVTDTYSSVPRKAKGKEISRAAGQGAFAPLLPRGRNRGPSNGATGGKYERRRRA